MIKFAGNVVQTAQSVKLVVQENVMTTNATPNMPETIFPKYAKVVVSGAMESAKPTDRVNATMTSV